MGAKSHEGFEFGSEQFLAAVLYVARDAEAQYKRHKAGGGRFPRWWYLNKVRKALNLDQPIDLPYSVMRAELIRFAESFGRTDYVPSAGATADAASTFDDIEEE